MEALAIMIDIENVIDASALRFLDFATEHCTMSRMTVKESDPLTCSFIRTHALSRAHGKEVFVSESDASTKYFN